MANSLRWTEEQLAEHSRKVPASGASRSRKPSEKPSPMDAKLSSAELAPAVGELRHAGMNKTEAEYAGMLEVRRQAGEVVWWKFEAITLRLADSTRYTPDFAVMLAGGQFELHETKGGFIREDGWLKLKVAAGMFPFRFFLCQKKAKKDGGQWSIEKV